jgi:hypothetical protein
MRKNVAFTVEFLYPYQVPVVESTVFYFTSYLIYFLQAVTSGTDAQSLIFHFSCGNLLQANLF